MNLATQGGTRSPSLRAADGADDVDVVVVGARCAGSATALLLARAGLRVLAVERSAEGSDTLSGHMIKPDGVGRLADWGVLDDLLASGCPPITRAEVVLHGRPEPSPAPSAGPLPLAPRRTVLDRLMQQHARAAGAEVCCRTTLRGLQDGAVVLGNGRQVRARLLIGADGRHSAVARAVGAGFDERRPGRSCAWLGYWTGAELHSLHAELEPGVFAGAFPTHDHAVLAFVQLPVAAWRRADGERAYRDGWPAARASHTRWSRHAHRRGCSVHASCPLSSGPRPAGAGPWSATPPTTKTHWPRGALPTPCSAPNGSPRTCCRLGPRPRRRPRLLPHRPDPTTRPNR